MTVTRYGALGGEDTIVTISETGSLFAKSKIVMAVDDYASIGIRWRSDKKLTVYVPQSALGGDFANQKVSIQNLLVDDVEVEYLTL